MCSAEVRLAWKWKNTPDWFPPFLHYFNIHVSFCTPTFTSLLASTSLRSYNHLQLLPPFLSPTPLSASFLCSFPSLLSSLSFLFSSPIHSFTPASNFSTSFNCFLPSFLALLIVSCSSSPPSFLSSNGSFAFLHLHYITFCSISLSRGRSPLQSVLMSCCSSFSPSSTWGEALHISAHSYQGCN